MSDGLREQLIGMGLSAAQADQVLDQFADAEELSAATAEHLISACGGHLRMGLANKLVNSFGAAAPTAFGIDIDTINDPIVDPCDALEKIKDATGSRRDRIVECLLRNNFLLVAVDRNGNVYVDDSLELRQALLGIETTEIHKLRERGMSLDGKRYFFRSISVQDLWPEVVEKKLYSPS